MRGMRLICLGDLMLARGVSKALAEARPEELWGDCLPSLFDADLRHANLECCISDGGAPFEPPRVFSFRAIPKAIDVLVAARIDVVNLANNHSLDYGEEALLDTLERLDRAGIAHVGAGADIEEARHPVVLEAAGRRIGFVGVADHYPEYAAGPARPGINWMDPAEGPRRVLEEVSEARAMGADLVVVSAHCGPNMAERPSALLAGFARGVVEGGADLWFGHSAHILQGVEFARERPVIHDGGDFLDDYAVDPVLRNDLSAIWRTTFDDTPRLECLPVRLGFARTDLAGGSDFAWVEQRMAALSREMGTRAARLGGTVSLNPST